MTERACIIDAYLAGEADPQQLRDWLAEDPAHIDRFTAACDIHWQLADALTNAERGSRNAQVKRRKRHTSQSAVGNRQLAIYSALAATLLAACGLAVYVYVSSLPQSPIPDPTSPNPDPAVATLIENTGDLRTPHGFTVEGDSYGRGEYTLDSGRAQFVLTNRVTVDLRGKTRLTMHGNMRATLTEGEATFNCPKGTEGYTVHVPGGAKVVDLGTRFRVSIEEDGATRIAVLEGRVEFVRGDDRRAADAGQVARIAAGQPIVVADSMIAVIDARDGTDNTEVFDLSEIPGGGAAGLIGSFTTTEGVYGDDRREGDRWNASKVFLEPGPDKPHDVATWTFGSLTDGDVFDVYASWRQMGQANNASNAPYRINGGEPIRKNQKRSPAADLTLTDPTDSQINFEYLGRATVVDGKIVVTVSDENADGFVLLDAIAIERRAIVVDAQEPDPDSKPDVAESASDPKPKHRETHPLTPSQGDTL